MLFPRALSVGIALAILSAGCRTPNVAVIAPRGELSWDVERALGSCR